MPYVPHVLYVLTYLTTTCLRALTPYVPSFFMCLTCVSFFTCLTCLHFLHALRSFIFYMPYFPSFFTCLTCLHFLRAFIVLHAYILFTYMLIKLTQINEFTYDCSSLLLLNSVIYQLLSSIFTSIKLVSYSA